MEATKVLMEEHQVIEQVLNSLKVGVHRLEGDQAIHPEFFLLAADFIGGFADGCHHKKEEGVLFPAMEAAGVLRNGGPIGVMLAEHEETRGLARTMRESAERLKAGDASAKEDIRRSALAYIAVLQQHIHKENNILFPMADRILTEAQHKAVSDGFKRVEHEEAGEGVHQKYLALARALEAEAG